MFVSLNKHRSEIGTAGTADELRSAVQDSRIARFFTKNNRFLYLGKGNAQELSSR